MTETEALQDEIETLEDKIIELEDNIKQLLSQLRAYSYKIGAKDYPVPSLASAEYMAERLNPYINRYDNTVGQVTSTQGSAANIQATQQHDSLAQAMNAYAGSIGVARRQGF